MAVRISDEEIRNWIQQIDLEDNALSQEERQKRDELLLSKLRILFNQNGFTKELMAQMDTKYFVEKGFTIPESILLTKPENTSHPSKEEIRHLRYDEQTKILNLEFQSQANLNQQNVKNYYIIVLGPTNRGKTTFVFNMINKIYNITRDSLYRIKKPQVNQQQQKYYDEYTVQIDQNKNYVFADFRGMGDFKLDFLGVNDQEENQKTLYTEILNYMNLHSNNILAILFCNSSSINRLGQDEKYQLQRFFELIPKQYERKIQLILTYCTDNQPLMAVYESFQGMPENLRTILNNQQRQQSDKFWFGINNANLYNPIDYVLEAEQRQENQIEQDQPQENEQKDNDELLQEGYLQQFNQLPNNLPEILNQFNNNKHQFLRKIVFKEAGNIDDQNQDEQGQGDIELPEYEWPKLYYNQMLSILEEIQSRFLVLEQTTNQNQEQNLLKNYLKNKLKFEKAILNIQSNLKLIEDLKKQNHRFIISQIQFTNYIKNVPLNQKENAQTKIAKRQTKFLFCRSCSKLCHSACHLISLEEIYSNQKMCRKLQSDEFKKIVDQIQNYNQLTLEEKKKFANEYVKCKICFKRNGKSCKLEDHQVTTQIQETDQKNIPYMLSNQNNLLATQNQFQSSIIQLSQNFNPEDMIQYQFIHQYQQYRQSKKLQRLYQQNVFKVELEHQQLIENTKTESKMQENQGLLQVDLDQRFKFLNAIQVQLKNTAMNDDFGLKLDEILKIYSKFQTDRPVEQNNINDKPVEQNNINDRPVEQNNINDRPVEQNNINDRPVGQNNIEMSFAQSQQLLASNQNIQIDNNRNNNLHNSSLFNTSNIMGNSSFVNQNQNQENRRLITGN